VRQYLDQIKTILEHGEKRMDRTGTGTTAVFGMQAKYDLREGFPMVTTKKVLWNGILRELLWFLKGSTNINDGLTQYTPIWDAWAGKDGELGPIYGYQWRSWQRANKNPETGELIQEPVDQISEVISQIKTNPSSRRLIVSAWNVGDVPKMALPPCHLLFQFFVAGDRLDLQLYQRSADMALGVPFNIASYALLLMMVAQECNLTPGIFVHTIGDAHIYLNHIEGLQKQLVRDPLPLPQVKIAKKNIFDLQFEDFELVGYEHHPFIKFTVSV
jgi:thymidylate synthase